METKFKNLLNQLSEFNVTINEDSNGIITITPKVEKFEPKVGDIVKNESYLFIFDGLTYEKNENWSLLKYNICDDTIEKKREIFGKSINNIKPTKKEIALFYKAVRECGYIIQNIYNIEKKRAYKYKSFYYVIFDLANCQFKVAMFYENYNVTSDLYFKNGNYFLEEEEAQKATNKLNAKLDLKEFFKKIKEEEI